MAFVNGVALGAGPTRQAAQDMAYRAATARVLTGGAVTTAARAERAQTESGLAVTASADLQRIFTLPRFACPDLSHATRAFSDPGAPLAELRPFQLWALYHLAFIHAHYPGRGIIVSAGVGHGKTLVGLLAARVISAQRPLVLIPAALMDQWTRDIERYRALGFGFPQPALASHESLGAPTGGTVLDDLNPDLVVIDEAGAFANGTAARTRRLSAWKANAPDARMICMSGTLLRSSLRDVAGLAAMTLGDLSPIPLHYPDLEAVASAVDADARLMRCRPGVLRQFAPPSLPPGASDLTVSRAAVRNLLRDRLGYVTVRPEHRLAGETAAPLRYAFHRSEPPADLTAALAKLDADWVHPISGDMLSEALQKHRVAGELALGFVTRWVPPPPADWDEPRRAIAKALHRACKGRVPKGHPDTPGAWSRALRKGKAPPKVVEMGDEINPDPQSLQALWDAWTAAAAAHGTTDAPAAKYPGSERVTDWLSDYAIRAAVAWGMEAPGLIWTRTPQVGEAVAAAGGWPYYGAGGSGAALAQETGSRTVVLSMPVHHKGRNLQCYHRNLILQPTGSADVLEQCVGRTHRAGQGSAVSVEIFAPSEHAEQSVMAALRRSGFVEEIEGTEYKAWKCRDDLEFIHAADPEWVQQLEGDT